MAETNVTEPKTAAIKKTDDSILGACCYKLKRFWKAHKIVYLKVFGTITLYKTEKRQTSKHKKADQTTQKRKEQLDVIKNMFKKYIGHSPSLPKKLVFREQIVLKLLKNSSCLNKGNH